ncbi:MAG: hypothetical protein M3O90_07035 [Actinomycetota bacterium]|nr:hypothetical protein [Actinomycetota bacterium]
MGHERGDRTPSSKPDARARDAQPQPVQPLTAHTPVEQVLALQRSAGNQAVVRLLGAAPGPRLARDYTMPLASTVAPGTAGATEFADFLKIIRAEEAKVSPAELADTKSMITKLRKLFYGTQGWDKYLIPGAAGTKPLYDTEETEKPGSRERVKIEGAHVDYVEHETRLKGAPTALTDPAKIQEVRMPNGDFVDVGHVFAGLDALNFPSKPSAPGGFFEVSSNVGAVTWVGDLASVLSEVVIKSIQAGKKKWDDADIQAQIDRMAPAQDMLGNIDAYVIGDAFAGDIGKTSGGRPVSDILEQYYGGAGVASPAGEKARNQRFTIFARKVGLGALSGSAFANEAAWLKQASTDVANAAALYTATVTDNDKYDPIGYAHRGAMASGISLNPMAGKLAAKFLAELKVKVQAEAASAAPVAP